MATAISQTATTDHRLGFTSLEEETAVDSLPVVGEHCSDTEELVQALEDGSAAALDRGHRRAAELAERDALFPDVLPALAAALGGSRSLVLG